MNNRDVLESCFKHHQYVLNNKEYFLTDKTIDATQYMNYTVHAQQVKLTELFYKQLRRIHNHKLQVVFLNLSVGPPFLEMINRKFKNDVRISSAEFHSQIKCYDAIKKYYDIDPVNYICTDFDSENFEILKCKTFFTYVVLRDFVPYWKIQDLKLALSKFKIYSKRIILLEKDTNLTKFQQNYLNVKSYETINIMEDWKMYSLKIKSLDESV